MAIQNKRILALRALKSVVVDKFMRAGVFTVRPKAVNDDVFIPSGDRFLLLETGDFFLLESGDKLLLESR